MATGKVVRKLGDDVSTDIIYPGRFMATVLPTETPQFAFADDAEFNRKLKAKEIPPGSFIVAGRTSAAAPRASRPPRASRATSSSSSRGTSRASSCRTRSTSGSHMVICPAIEAEEGDELEITDGKVWNRTTGKSFAIEPLPQGAAGDHRRGRPDPVRAPAAAGAPGALTAQGAAFAR